MQPGSDRFGRPDRSEVWSEETHCRVLSQGGSGEGGGVVHCITESHLHLIRVRATPGAGNLLPSMRLEMPKDGEPGEKISQVLGRARYNQIPTPGQMSLENVVKSIVEDSPDCYLDFYNRAGNLSLKVHAFQLLPGVGSVKAQEMVKSRDRLGWDSLEEVDRACSIESAQLLAERLVEELKDSNLKPSLLDNVVRLPSRK